jgi:predicted ATP-dependent serine protease
VSEGRERSERDETDADSSRDDRSEPFQTGVAKRDAVLGGGLLRGTIGGPSIGRVAEA